MLTITVPGIELYDEIREEFTTAEGFSLELEHSLVSLSKWEAIYKKPFLGPETKTSEEVYEYVRCMNLKPNVSPEVFSRLSRENLEEISAYIDEKMSATTFSENSNAPKSREIITSELIYYWMIEFNIPVEFQHWHLNRLITLIKVCSLKKVPPKKISRSDLIARNRALNEQRRAQLGTKG